MSYPVVDNQNDKRGFNMGYSCDLVGARIRKRRKELKLSQVALAEALDVNVKTVKDWEKANGANPTLPKFVELCNVLNCHADYLFGLIDMPFRALTDINKFLGLSEKSVSTLLRYKHRAIQEQTEAGEPTLSQRRKGVLQWLLETEYDWRGIPRRYLDDFIKRIEQYAAALIERDAAEQNPEQAYANYLSETVERYGEKFKDFSQDWYFDSLERRCDTELFKLQTVVKEIVEMYAEEVSNGGYKASKRRRKYSPKA